MIVAQGCHPISISLSLDGDECHSRQTHRLHVLDSHVQRTLVQSRVPYEREQDAAEDHGQETCEYSIGEIGVVYSFSLSCEVSVKIAVLRQIMVCADLLTAFQHKPDATGRQDEDYNGVECHGYVQDPFVMDDDGHDPLCHEQDKDKNRCYCEWQHWTMP